LPKQGTGVIYVKKELQLERTGRTREREKGGQIRCKGGGRRQDKYAAWPQKGSSVGRERGGGRSSSKVPGIGEPGFKAKKLSHGVGVGEKID